MIDLKTVVFRVMLITFLLLLILSAVVFRVMQLIYAIDSSTGFYASWHFSLPALDITLPVGIVLIAVCVFFLRRTPVSARFTGGAFGTSFLSALCAAGLTTQCVLQVMQSDTLTALGLLSILLSGISAISFWFIVFKPALAKPKGGFFLFRNIMLILWCCAEILTVFFDDSSLSNTSEYLFVILFFYAATIFFVKYGKLYFVKKEEVQKSFLLIGSASMLAVLGFLLSVPNLIIWCFGGTSLKTTAPYVFSAFPLAVYGFVFVYHCCAAHHKTEPGHCAGALSEEAV